MLLERMTRECYEIVRDRRDVLGIPELQDEVRKTITRYLAELVSRIAPPAGKHISASTRIFLATNFRGLRGQLRTVAPQSSGPTPLAWRDFIWDYGTLGEHGTLVSREDANFFMPVAFWAHGIYERPFAHIKQRKLSLGGFSRWIHECGMLATPDKTPLYGLHFCIDDKVRKTKFKSDAGLIAFRFPTDIPALAINEEFNKGIYRLHVQSSRQSPGRRVPSLPIICADDLLPVPRGQHDSVAQSVFSTFFYSNFNDPKINVSWDACVQNPDLYHELFDKHQQCLEDCEEEDGDILTFRHYYAFLLNPGLGFRSEPNQLSTAEAALGTVNFYTNIPIPVSVIAAIRVHLESICHLIRDIEEWQEGQKEGSTRELRRWTRTLGHEWTKILAPLATCLDPEHMQKVPPEVAGMIQGYCRESIIYCDIWTGNGKNRNAIVCDSWTSKDSLTRSFLRICEVGWHAHIIREKATGFHTAGLLSLNNTSRLYARKPYEVTLDLDPATMSIYIEELEVWSSWFSLLLLALVHNGFKYSSTTGEVPDSPVKCSASFEVDCGNPVFTIAISNVPTWKTEDARDRLRIAFRDHLESTFGVVEMCSTEMFGILKRSYRWQDVWHLAVADHEVSIMGRLAFPAVLNKGAA